ncbi:LacI family DNA-binding transcriptional regulator [uncultured Arcticibacterium sp.]|uniref:LacI family DNA-binding transcriptional regulator n=1 Tax=uncultured Arcticibacterium sp. TaxID=2173042 RepID=UPI0030F65362
MKRVTIKELAKVLNLSISTVSRALSDHPDISQDTKKKVREASELYNYTPNLRARYLRTKSSGLIGLILPEYHMFFIPEMMKSISEAVSKKGYSLLVFQSDDSYQKELDLIEYCNQLSVDGIMISISSGFINSEELSKLNKDGAPLVLLDKIQENDDMSSVGIDGAGIAKESINYLIKNGHRKMGGVFSDSSQMITETRLAGFKQACEENNIEPLILMISDLDRFDETLLNFLNVNKGVSALFAMTDELMMRCHSGLQRHSYKIPEDISLIVISDGVMPKILHPRITHYFHSPKLVGETAVNLLLERIKDKTCQTKTLKIDCSLVELESVKDLN